MKITIGVLNSGAMAGLLAYLLEGHYPWWIVVLVPVLASLSCYWRGLEEGR